MDEHLPPVFEFLADLSAPIAHYKVCSTFDSSPEIGSIGRAIELARPKLGGDWVPMVVAAPPIGRYQSFGNLFAIADGVVYRLDRHPTMSTHPVTPMHEADVRTHLAAQTSIPIGLINAVSLADGRASESLQREIDDGAHIVALDVADDAMLLELGRLMWENKGDRILAVGSQGVEYALVRYWREMGMIASDVQSIKVGPAERFAGVSASVSPVTASQLEWAGENGFELIRMDVSAAVDIPQWEREINSTSEQALRCVERGSSPIVYTALGPNDRSILELQATIERSDVPAPVVRERIGDGLGQVLDQLVRGAGITRCAVVGGDTSGHVTRALGIRSLTFLFPMGHATSMMLANTGSLDRPPIEYTLKGGQMGSIDFFGAVRDLNSTI